MNANLPRGYTTSSIKPEYEQGAVDVINAFWHWINGGNATTLQEMQAEWSEEEFNRETDSRLVIDPEGRVVGYNDVWDLNALHVRSFSWMAVLPELIGDGIGDYLMQWGLERAAQNVAKASEGARVVMHMSMNINCQPMLDLYERHGFRDVRHSYRMRIDFDQAPEPPVIPEGIVIRPMIAGKEERDAIYVAYDSFLDHWGFVEEPFEEHYKRWMNFIKSDPNYDPSLYFIAFEGDEAVGISLCDPKIEEVPNMAWVGTLGVTRRWRKRGLGLALLRHSFQEFYRRGIRSAGLGVDAQNLTGALRLYEKAGMRVWRESCVYEYELRAGKDLMRQTIDQEQETVDQTQG